MQETLSYAYMYVYINIVHNTRDSKYNYNVSNSLSLRIHAVWIHVLDSRHISKLIFKED